MRSDRDYGDREAWVAPTDYGISVETPVEGFYKVKLGKNTVLRAVQLVFGPPPDPVTGEPLDRSWRWMAFLDDGALIDLDRVWPVCARDKITEQEWQRCRARHEWARQHAPDSAYAERGKRLDPLSTQTPLPF